jgi:glycerate 2-kinase
VRILIAPDKFKGSLDAREVAENVEKGLRKALLEAKIDILPMADGGEGTAEVICNALGGSWLKCNAHDPLGREIDARYAWIDKAKVAVMEMSEAAGMRRVLESERDPLRANTFGVGEMILDAERRGAGKIIIGLGGSATNDGGSGMARAIGFRFFGGEQELNGAVSELQKLTRIQKPKNLALPKIVAAVDVKNPLLGERGATRVFGPQKGVTDEKIDILERGLTRLADAVENQFGFDYRNEPGAGAAGGLGFGLMSFCGAKIRPGFDVVAAAVALEAKMKDVDLVVTGEGSLDRQTLQGKTPAGVAKLARRLGKRVYAFAGRADEDQEVRKLFHEVYLVRPAGMNEQESVARAAELLVQSARRLAEGLKKTASAERPTSSAK